MLKTKFALAGNRTPPPAWQARFLPQPPMLETATIYPAQSHIKYCIHVKKKCCIGRESNPGLPRGMREFYH